MPGTPFVPTAPRGYGAQGRSRDETAPRRAPWRASLDGSEHRGTPQTQIGYSTSAENSIGTSEESSIGIDR